MLALLLGGAVIGLAPAPAWAEGSPDYTKVKGPDECAECHKKEVAAWKESHHFKTFTELPRAKEAKEISDKLGLKRIKTESVCLDCHFTSQAKGDKPRPIAGITCESCHGPAADYLKRHSEFSGKKKETESADERAQRWADAEKAGMIRPDNLYQLAKNCFSCHVVPKEELVNKGGHAAGSSFELVSWASGEVRHNTWHNGGKENRDNTAERKRMMYVIGVLVELETSLRSVGKSTASAKYAVAMAKRAHAARKRLREIAKESQAPELMDALRAAHGASLKLDNEAELEAAADKVGEAAKAFAAANDGTQLAAIDGLIPGPDKYKGKFLP
jgi:hypothetical protein